MVAFQHALLHDIPLTLSDTLLPPASDSVDQTDRERLRLLTEAFPVGVFQNAPDGRCVWVNATHRRMTGLSLEASLGTGWLAALTPESREQLAAAQALLETHGGFGPLTVELLRPDGSRGAASVRVSVARASDGTIEGQIGVLADITERRAEQRVIEESDERFRTVLDAIEEGIVLQDASGAVRLWNRATERILGLTGDQLLGVTSRDPNWRAIMADGSALPGELHPAMVALRRGKPVMAQVMGVMRPDGSRVWLRVSARPAKVPGPEGGPGVVATFVDITDARDADEQLRRSEEELRVATAAARDVICLHNLDGTYQWVSAGSLDVLGWDPEALIGENPYAYFHPEDIERIREESHQQILSGAAPKAIMYRFRRANGSYTWVETETAFVPATPEVPARLVTTSRSADYRVAADERNAMRQRLGGVAHFAGRLAHDFTNVSMVVQTRLEMLRDRLDGDLRDDVDAALEAVAQGSELTRALRALSGTEPLHMETVDVHEVVHALMVGFNDVPAQERAGTDTTRQIAVNTSDDVLPAVIDRSALASAIQSIVRNAVEAAGSKGRVTVSTRRVQLDEAHLDPHGEVPPGDWVTVRCHDTGPGIRPELLPRIFEPELSQKGAQVETGLGLPVTLARMQQMGGHVSVMNAPSGGTEVVLWLPLAEHYANEVAADDVVVDTRVASDRTLAPPSELGDSTAVLAHVLLVDDDPLVLRTAERLLVRGGYRVTPVHSGFAALDVLAQAASGQPSDQIDVIVTDVMMPGLTGPEFVAQRRALGDRRPVVYISGYSDRGILDRDGATPPVLISKPFTSAEFLAAIENALGVR